MSAKRDSGDGNAPSLRHADEDVTALDAARQNAMSAKERLDDAKAHEQGITRQLAFLDKAKKDAERAVRKANEEIKRVTNDLAEAQFKCKNALAKSEKADALLRRVEKSRQVIEIDADDVNGNKDGSARTVSPTSAEGVTKSSLTSNISARREQKEPYVLQHLTNPRARKRSTSDAAIRDPKRSKGSSSRGGSNESAIIDLSGASASSASSSSTNNMPSHLTIPERQKTVGEKLLCCEQALHPSSRTRAIAGIQKTGRSYATGGDFSKRYEEIFGFLRTTVETWGRSGSVGSGGEGPSTMHVCGGPGTGKTTAVYASLDKTKEWVMENKSSIEAGRSSNWKAEPVCCYVNATSASNDDIIREIAAELKCPATKTEVEKRLNSSGKTKKRVVLLVLDDIDTLLNKTAKLGSSPRGAGERLLDEVFAWACSPDYLFGLIGISNTVDDKKAWRLRELGDVNKFLTFPTYSKEMLIEIVEQRVGRTVVDPRVVEFAAAKVSVTSGDARKVLQLVASAVGNCQNSLSEDAKAQTLLEAPIVKMPHIVRAFRDLMYKHAEIISALPRFAQVVLCVAVTLSGVSPSWKEMSLSQLRMYCGQATGHQYQLLETTAMENFLTIIDQLTDAGLLIVTESGYSDSFDRRITLGVQLDEVEFAIDKTLGTQPFFRNMVEYVKKSNIDNKYS